MNGSIKEMQTLRGQRGLCVLLLQQNALVDGFQSGSLDDVDYIINN